MATNAELEYLVRVNDRDLKELKRNIDTVNKAADQDLGKASTAADSHLRKIHAGAAVAAAGVGGLLVVGIKKSIEAAVDSQRVQAQTQVQLKALGISYSDHAKQIDKTIQSTSKLAALDDEDLQQSFTRLLPATHNVNKALQQMQLAADIARARNISLESATQLVIRANTGSAGALRRLGISLTATTDHVAAARREYAAYKKTHDVLSPAMEKHYRDLIANAQQLDKNAQATRNLDTLQKTFSGSADTYGKSAAGAQERYKVAVENVQEAIGKGLLPILSQLLNFTSKLLDATQGHTKAIAIAVAVIGTLTVATFAISAATSVWTAAQTVARVATAAWTGAQWLLNAALEANPIGLVVLAIAALAAGLIIAWKKSETFRDIVKGALGVVEDEARTLRDAGAAIWHGFEATIAWVRAHWPIIVTLISGPFAPIVALATNAFGVRSALEGALDAVRNKADEVVGAVVGFFTDLPGKLKKPLNLVTSGLGPLKEALNLVGGALDKVRDGFDWILSHGKDLIDTFGKIGGALGSAAGKLNPFGDGIATIKGGLVTIPTPGSGPQDVSTGLWDDLALGTTMGLSMSSGYRPGSVTSTGNPSLHGVYPAKAIDMLGSEAAMQAFFRAEIGRPGIVELIHSPYWWHPGAGVQPIPPSAGTVLADHYSHVHVGIFDQGGTLPPGLTMALNLTGKPERVVPTGGEAPAVYVEHMTVNDPVDLAMLGSTVTRAIAFR